MSEPRSDFRSTRRVEFADTDMAGIMHFSNYFRYMESIEHEFFRSLGLSVHQSSPTGMVGYARVSASCDYRAPLRYQDVVEIHLLVAEKRSKSISYIAQFRKPGNRDAPPVAIGRWTVVCIKKQSGESELTSAALPEDVNALLQVAPSELIPAKGQ